ncbi:unnamed protein product [Alopecurus aequalis]
MVMMESSRVPPGFRFHPTDEELVGYYLRKKVASQRIDLDVIPDVDLYGIEPWELQERCRIGYEEQNDWYFFSYKDRKYPTGRRTNRATATGFWKATGRDKAVRAKAGAGGFIIGMRKTLVFYEGRAPNGRKSDWIVHEYRLDTDENGPPQEEGWVVCRAFKKRTMHPPRSRSGAWDLAGYSYRGPVLAGLAHFKQEGAELEVAATAAASAILRYSKSFAELPQLESPPLPSQCSSQLMASSAEGEGEEHNHDARRCYAAVSTDWNALDEFVASQFSTEEQGLQVCESPAGADAGNGADMDALLILDGGQEEAGRWLLSSVADAAGQVHPP